MTRSSYIAQKLRKLTKISSDATYLINRNPRNLEKLTIAYKPGGYHLEKPGRSFWHKLELNTTGRYVSANVVHYEAGTVLKACTSEWAIKKQLFKTNDTTAYINLARVLAQRCREAGLTEMSCTMEPVPNSKTDKFLKQLEAGGVELKEQERFVAPRPWHETRQEKPWEQDN